MKYTVEKTTKPEGYWLIIEWSDDIKKCGKAYKAGYSLVNATNLCERLNKCSGANIEQHSAGLYVCWNYHEKHEPCEYGLEIPYANESTDLYEQCRELGYFDLDEAVKDNCVVVNTSTGVKYADMPTGNSVFILDPIKATNDIYPTVKAGSNQPDANGLLPGGGGTFTRSWKAFRERRERKKLAKEFELHFKEYFGGDSALSTCKAIDKQIVKEAIKFAEKTSFIGNSTELARLQLDEACQWPLPSAEIPSLENENKKDSFLFKQYSNTGLIPTKEEIHKFQQAYLDIKWGMWDGNPVKDLTKAVLMDGAAQWEVVGIDPYGFKEDETPGKVELITGSAGELETNGVDVAKYFYTPPSLPMNYQKDTSPKSGLPAERKSLIHLQLPPGAKPTFIQEINLEINRLHIRLSQLEYEISILKQNNQLNVEAKTASAPAQSNRGNS